MSPNDPRHGTTAGYNAHRKESVEPCAACRKAAADYEDRRSKDALLGRSRTVDALGVRRRVQALMAIGWSAEEQAKALGWTNKHSVQKLRFRKHVLRSTHEQVSEMYERLSGRPGPSVKTRARAEAAGYPPPLAWDDIDNPDEIPTGHRVCQESSCAREVVYVGLCLPHYRASRKAAA